MSRLIVIAPEAVAAPTQQRLESLLRAKVPPNTRWIRDADELDICAGERLLFAIALDRGGMNAGLDRIKRRLAAEPGLLHNATAAICVDGPGQLFTKSVAREMVFRANRAGCGFIPKPLIEATGNLYNFELRAHLLDTDLDDAYAHHLGLLVERLIADDAPEPSRPAKLLAICSTNRAKVANSVCYWNLVREALGDDIDAELVNLGKGKVYDCRGCTWERCTGHGCPQPDPLRDGIFERIAEADAMLLLAPNLNDSIGADLAALVNRLTHLANCGLIRSQYAYAIIVSGYSGGDLLARQILNGLCLNKGFRLPPYFAAMETANRPRAIMEDPDVANRAARYAAHIRATLLPELEPAVRDD